ncbi:hypothetical protein L0128_12485 [candidate division KSB1 bacterium]|nr:hypothetical protein [candidate division KSB1 bacterium]
MKKAKIKPTLKTAVPKISPTQPTRLNENIIFSFKYLDFTNTKFQLPDAKPDYFPVLIKRFQSICNLTLNQFRVDCAASMHRHSINWKTATEKDFKNLPQQLQDGEDFQFSISKVKYGRIHGVLSDNIFFIVWFDPDHKLFT